MANTDPDPREPGHISPNRAESMPGQVKHDEDERRPQPAQADRDGAEKDEEADELLDEALQETFPSPSRAV